MRLGFGKSSKIHLFLKLAVFMKVPFTFRAHADRSHAEGRIVSKNLSCFCKFFERLQRVEAFRFENLNCWRQYYIVSKNLSNLLFLANTDSNTDSNMDSNTDSSTVANTDPNADYSTDSNKDTNTEAHTDPDTDSNTDSKAESNIDSNKDSKKDSNTDSNTNPNTDSPMRIRIQICNPRWI